MTNETKSNEKEEKKAVFGESQQDRRTLIREQLSKLLIPSSSLNAESDKYGMKQRIYRYFGEAYERDMSLENFRSALNLYGEEVFAWKNSLWARGSYRVFREGGCMQTKEEANEELFVLNAVHFYECMERLANQNKNASTLDELLKTEALQNWFRLRNERSQ